MIILYILKFLGLFLLILLAALLFIPFGYMFAGRKYESAAVRSSISWLFGLVRITYKKSIGSKGHLILQLLGLNFKLNPKKGKQDKQELEEEKQNKKQSAGSMRFLNKDFINSIFKAFIDLFNHIKPKRFYLEGRFGFEDPYYTAMGSALLKILRLHLKDIQINARAVFDEEVLEGRLLISGRMVLIRVFYIALKLYSKKHVRRVIKPKEAKLYVN